MDFQLWKARDLDRDLGSGHTAYRRASLIDVYLHVTFRIKENFCGQMDGHLRPALLGGVRRDELTIKQ